MKRPRARTLGPALLGGVVAVAAGTVVLAAAAPAGAGVLPVSPTGKFVVKMRGNGHGHGMSQYGARGAAIAGKTYAQIVAFYYPGTTLTKVPSRIIRVQLSNTGSAVTIGALSLTTVTGVSGYLPTSGISRYRLVADSGTGITLQKLATSSGAQWANVRTGLPNHAEFYRHGGVPTRVYLADGTSTDYDGYLQAVRASSRGSSGGVRTVDRVNMDRYTAGVVPREMPASWQRAAVDAQAVAARTYGAYALAHPQSSGYDICDTSQCQVYGGNAHYSASGSLLWSNFVPAATDTSNQVLEYKGAAIFAQFSASNGGWTVSGGQPYLPAKADPYDNAASGDPYLYYLKTLTVAGVAAHFGLAKVTSLAVTTRDGNGGWGGRVLTGYVRGTTGSGSSKTVELSGFDFEDLFGIGTTWFEMRQAP